MRAGKDAPQGFLSSYIIKVEKILARGSYLFMKSTPRVPSSIPLIDIGYKYNSRKVLGFIATEGYGITETGDNYLSHFPNIFLIFLFVPLFVLAF